MDPRIVDMAEKYVGAIASLTDPPLLATVYLRRRAGETGVVLTTDDGVKDNFDAGKRVSIAPPGAAVGSAG